MLVVVVAVVVIVVAAVMVDDITVGEYSCFIGLALGDLILILIISSIICC